MSEISICVPVHDPKEMHEDFLLDAFHSIRTQTLYPKEVLMSGSFRPAYLKNLLKIFNEFFPVRFIKNKSWSTSSNLNSVVPYCSGSIVKILFQDDFFISNTALASTYRSLLKKDTIWTACASRNFDNEAKRYVGDVNPIFNKKIAIGSNSIGSPSVIAFKKDHYLPFNEKLVWMLDCEWYLQMQHRYGDPVFLKDFQIANRLHQFQATHKVNIRHDSEAKIIKGLHFKTKTFRNFFVNRKCSCLGKH